MKFCLILCAVILVSCNIISQTEAQCSSYTDCNDCLNDNTCIWCTNGATSISCTDYSNSSCAFDNQVYECTLDANCVVAAGTSSEPMILQTDGSFVGVFSGNQITPVLCPDYIKDWMSPGACAIATPVSYTVDFSAYTGNPSDIYNIPNDELDFLYLLGILADPEVAGSQKCLQGAGASFCAIAWAPCNPAKNCLDYINSAWCNTEQDMCGEINNQAIVDEYGQFYLDSLNYVNCSNSDLYSDSGTPGKRQDRQLRRDYTPPPTTATPPTQCSLPKSSSAPDKSAPPTTVKHPCNSTSSDATTPQMSKALMLSMLAGMNLFLGQE